MTDTRKCTCHPDDNPPIPCARKYALHDCLKERIQQLTDELQCLIGIQPSVTGYKRRMTMGDRFWAGLVIGMAVIASVFAVAYEMLVRYLGV